MAHRLVLFFFLVSVSSTCWGWGAKGHRVVGQIAETQLTETSKSILNRLLDGDTLASVSNWPDYIKSYAAGRGYGNWHYTSVDDGLVYSDASAVGLAGVKIKEMIGVLSGSKPRPQGFTNRMVVAWLVHLVGDSHNPLHAGRVGDRGGNDIIVSYFGELKNLHQVWDSSMIENDGLSFTELAKKINTLQRKSKLDLGHEDPNKWVNESIQLRPYVYDLVEGTLKEIGGAPAPLKPESAFHSMQLSRLGSPSKGRLPFDRIEKIDMRKCSTYAGWDDSDTARSARRQEPGFCKQIPRLGYSYSARNMKVVENRLLQAGIRLGKVLNQALSSSKGKLK